MSLTEGEYSGQSSFNEMQRSKKLNAFALARKQAHAALFFL